VVAYQQFFASPQGGIRGGRTTLESLRRMPCPLDAVPRAERRQWLSLQRRRAREVYGPTPDSEIDSLVFAAFGLDEREVALVEDFVRITMPLTYGDRLGPAAQEPTHEERAAYAHFLKHSLDGHATASGRRHSVEISLAPGYGVVRVGPASAPGALEGTPASDLSHRHPQWLYFDRNLLLSHGDTHCLLKPLQRFWWTRAQALADFDQLAARGLASERGPQ